MTCGRSVRADVARQSAGGRAEDGVPEELSSIYAAGGDEGLSIIGGEMKDITPPPKPHSEPDEPESSPKTMNLTGIRNRATA